MDKSTREQLNLIAQTIDDKKGLNLLGIDLRHVSDMTDFLIIAEGNVDRHVKALHDAVVEEMRKRGQKPFYVEGVQAADWIVIDYGWVMVHLFIPELRDWYRLEELWRDGTLIEFSLSKGPSN
jgi:ribosome-associated protein